MLRRLRKPEPALVTGLVLAVIRLVVGLGFVDEWNVDEERIAVLVDVALGLAGALFIRERVTPSDKGGNPRTGGVV